jgi:hypothetical protein
MRIRTRPGFGITRRRFQPQHGARMNIELICYLGGGLVTE